MRLAASLTLSLLLVAGALAQTSAPAPADGHPTAATGAAVDSASLAQGRQAMWRSAALDGWGQAHNREWIKALVFSAGEITLVSSAVVQHRRWRRWQERRRLATDPAELAYFMKEEDFYLRDRNKLVWWWLWLKLGCVLDAYVSGSMSNFDAGWADVARLRPALVRGAPGLELRLPWPDRRGGADATRRTAR